MKKPAVWAKRFCSKTIPGWLYLLLLALVVALRIGIAFCQRVFLLPGQSGLDDMLMIRAAVSITQGNWLGDYGGVAIAKNMGYALWLALLHQLHLPVLPAAAALWVGACGFAAWALKPVLPGNLGRLVVFGFLAFQPVSFAFFTQRVYRDNIFPAFCLLFFAGIVGLGLRMGGKTLRGAVACALVSGVGLGAAWLLREDGPVLLVFGLCACALLLAFALWGRPVLRRAAKAVCSALPLVVLAVFIGLFSAANRHYYGVFTVNDLTSGSFPKAYGAMVGVSRAVSGDVVGTPVTRQALQQLYSQVPSLAPLQNSLQSGPAYNGFANLQTGEFGGSFYFALRIAAETEGLTPNAPAAQQYWATVYTEIETAVQQGRLSWVNSGASTVPYWQPTLAGPLAAEGGKAMMELLTFQNCNPRPAFSQGDEESIATVAAFLYSPVQQGYAQGTTQPYYNVVQRLVFTGCDVLIWLYRIAVWPLLLLALAATVRLFIKGGRATRLQKRPAAPLLTAFIATGLLLSLLLRVGVAAYMEVAAFFIGTYIMYYSPAVPPLLLFCLLPLLAALHGSQSVPVAQSQKLAESRA